MLKNFLEALDFTGASKKITRVILTAGATQHGVNLGAVKLPMEESDSWTAGEGRSPALYYNQQRIRAEVGKTASWCT